MYFQIWSKFHLNEKYIIKENINPDLKIYSLSDGGTPSTTRNKDMFYKCDIYFYRPACSVENMKYYESFDSLPRKKGYGIILQKIKKLTYKNLKNNKLV